MRIDCLGMNPFRDGISTYPSCGEPAEMVLGFMGNPCWAYSRDANDLSRRYLSMQIEFFTGIPARDGWYLVELNKGILVNQPYDVDYCRAKSDSDGGGREWVKYYSHNIKRWAQLPVEMIN